MCIIVFKPAGVALPPRENLETAFSNNPDGAGYMIAPPSGGVFIRKGFFKFEEFYEALVEDYERFGGESLHVAMHMRIATSGEVNARMCHPFPLPLEREEWKREGEILWTTAPGAVVHNGVLFSPRGEESDTYIFTRDILTPLLRGGGDPRSLAPLAGGNKFVVFLGGEVYIINEDEGVWDGGAWYSNTSYRSCPFVFNSQDYIYREMLIDEVAKLCDAPREVFEDCTTEELEDILQMMNVKKDLTTEEKDIYI